VVDEILQSLIPKETKATCDDCVMLSPARNRTRLLLLVRPRTKCCTYIPELPNFLVGRILCDDDPAFAKGRATLVKRLDEGVAVTPLGVGRSPTYRLLYEHAAGLMAFGRNPGSSAASLPRGRRGHVRHLASPQVDLRHLVLQVTSGARPD